MTAMDRTIVADMRYEDLDLDLVDTIIRRSQALGRYNGVTDCESYLERFGGVVRDTTALRPTIAGAVAFAREPDRWVSASGIDLARFDADPQRPPRRGGKSKAGQEHLFAWMDEERVPGPIAAEVTQLRGPIFEIIDAAVATLERYCTINRLEGARISRELDTPPIVLRELTTNGVVHRDMAIFGSQVRIMVYPSLIEWVSPGSLPPGIRVETLLTAQFSRNPSLAQFLFHAGYIEKFGMGIDAVIQALHQAGRGYPSFTDLEHSFRVRVERPRFQEQRRDMSHREGRTAAILALFDEQVTWQQNEIQDRLNISRSTLQRDLRTLLAEGNLIAEGSTRDRVYRRPAPSTADDMP
ncbi:MAG: HTH domain-containing protein [Blastochloris sp.]|nr:HTH domain-containing protein [Blastochloris sp.]